MEEFLCSKSGEDVDVIRFHGPPRFTCPSDKYVVKSNPVDMSVGLGESLKLSLFTWMSK